MNVSSFLLNSAGQIDDVIIPTTTHTRGGSQSCRLVPCHPSRLAPQEVRAITQQVGLPVGVMTVGAMTVGVMIVGVLTVGGMTVGSTGRPQKINMNVKLVRKNPRPVYIMKKNMFHTLEVLAHSENLLRLLSKQLHDI